jgi:hypothetical protein
MLTGSGNSPVDYPKPTVFDNPPSATGPGIQKRLFTQIVRIKASLNYNEAIGKDLGVIAIPDTIKPITNRHNTERYPHLKIYVHEKHEKHEQNQS